MEKQKIRFKVPGLTHYEMDCDLVVTMDRGKTIVDAIPIEKRMENYVINIVPYPEIYNYKRGILEMGELSPASMIALLGLKQNYSCGPCGYSPSKTDSFDKLLFSDDWKVLVGLTSFEDFRIRHEWQNDIGVINSDGIYVEVMSGEPRETDRFDGHKAGCRFTKDINLESLVRTPSGHYELYTKTKTLDRGVLGNEEIATLEKHKYMIDFNKSP